MIHTQRSIPSCLCLCVWAALFSTFNNIYAVSQVGKSYWLPILCERIYSTCEPAWTTDDLEKIIHHDSGILVGILRLLQFCFRELCIVISIFSFEICLFLHDSALSFDCVEYYVHWISFPFLDLYHLLNNVPKRMCVGLQVFWSYCLHVMWQNLDISLYRRGKIHKEDEIEWCLWRVQEGKAIRSPRPSVVRSIISVSIRQLCNAFVNARSIEANTLHRAKKTRRSAREVNFLRIVKLKKNRGSERRKKAGLRLRSMKSLRFFQLVI